MSKFAFTLCIAVGSIFKSLMSDCGYHVLPRVTNCNQSNCHRVAMSTTYEIFLRDLGGGGIIFDMLYFLKFKPYHEVYLSCNVIGVNQIHTTSTHFKTTSYNAYYDLTTHWKVIGISFKFLKNCNFLNFVLRLKIGQTIH